MTETISAGATNTKPYETFLLEELCDRELAAAYLAEALTQGSTEEFLLALCSVLRSLGLDLTFTPTIAAQ